MTSFLLDTDGVIDYFKGFRPTLELIQQLVRQGDDLCTCDVVVAEVYSGLTPDERPLGEAFLAALRFVAASPEASRQAGQWRYAYARRGRQLATTDCLVAAIAHDLGLTVITGNGSEFPMPELRIRLLTRTTSGNGRSG